jgi:hypothetical protein
MQSLRVSYRVRGLSAGEGQFVERRSGHLNPARILDRIIEVQCAAGTVEKLEWKPLGTGKAAIGAAAALKNFASLNPRCVNIEDPSLRTWPVRSPKGRFQC